MAAKNLTAAQQQQLTAMGIDWNNLDWTKIVQLLQLLASIFLSKPLVGAAGDPAQCAETCKAHFELIKAVAECGAACCGGK